MVDRVQSHTGHEESTGIHSVISQYPHSDFTLVLLKYLGVYDKIYKFICLMRTNSLYRQQPEFIRGKGIEEIYKKSDNLYSDLLGGTRDRDDV